MIEDSRGIEDATLRAEAIAALVMCRFDVVPRGLDPVVSSGMEDVDLGPSSTARRPDRFTDTRDRHRDAADVTAFRGEI